MATLYPKLILDTLSKVKYPGNGKDIVSLGMVEDDIKIEGKKVSFSIIFDKPNDPFRKSLIKSCEATLQAVLGDDIEIKNNIAIKTKPQAPIMNPKELPNVKHIVAVSSGKGGVGKSTVAANLAVGLALKGFKVGLLDADIFGPSVPKMFGVEDAKPFMEKMDGKDRIIPIEKFGIKLLSIGFFVDPNNALVWRGAMATGAIKQLIMDAYWGELDYFIIDFPPGTSDIHLTIIQTLEIAGAVIISTPQEVALADARKGISMFTSEKINIPILGLVENMAWFTPAELPNNKYYIFGKEGCKKLAESMGVPLLAQIPLVQSIMEQADNGVPIVLNEESVLSHVYLDLAEKVSNCFE